METSVLNCSNYFQLIFGRYLVLTDKSKLLTVFFFFNICVFNKLDDLFYHSLAACYCADWLHWAFRWNGMMGVQVYILHKQMLFHIKLEVSDVYLYYNITSTYLWYKCIVTFIGIRIWANDAGIVLRDPRPARYCVKIF